MKLTKRELQALELIGKGLSNRHAAQVMDVSKRTVDFHLQNAYGKLNVENRVQALNVARRAGILAA